MDILIPLLRPKEQILPGEDSLQLELIHECGLKVTLDYSIDQTGYVIRKLLTLSNIGNASLLIRRVDLEPLKLLNTSWQYPLDIEEIKELSNSNVPSPNEATPLPMRLPVNLQ